MVAPSKKRLLRIETPDYVADCVWICVSGIWLVDKNQCAPVLRWILELMPGTAVPIVSQWLDYHRSSYRHEWIEMNE